MKNSASGLIDILNAATRSISKAQANSEISSIIEALLLDFTKSELSTFLLYNKSSQALCMEKKGKKTEIPMANPRGLLGNAFLSKKTAIYNHVASNKHYVAEIDNPNNSRIKSQMIVPILSGEDMLCIVSVSRSTLSKNNYMPHDMELIKSLAPFLIKVSRKLASGNSAKVVLTPSEPEINEKIIKIEERSDGSDKCDDMMQFFANTVHDIRTPANSLYGFLDLIESKITDERIKGFIENAKESAKFINDMTTSLLDQAKQEHVDTEIELVEVNGIRFFSQIADSFSANMSNKNIEYLIYIDPSIPKKLSVEALKLKRVLINLIGNAYKFTPQGKQIAFIVIYNAKTATVTISINDHGIGIAEDKQKEIFKAYSQAEDDTSEKFGGTGLGLSICAQYVDELGGKLSLNSVIDEGSKFYFDIPVDIVDSRPSQASFVHLDKIVTILTDRKESANTAIIINYLVSLGLPKTRIIVSDTLHDSSTHLFCYQHKATSEIISKARDQGMKFVVIEESLFALENNSLFNDVAIMSNNTYYGDMVHKTVLTESISRALVVDDNQINIHLINAILESEYCEVVSVLNGDEAISKFREAHTSGRPFDMLFLDKHLPTISGNEVIHTIRTFEKNKNINPLFAISITGDPEQTDEEKEYFDLLVTKPFKNSDLKEAFLKAVKFKKEQ